MPHLAQLKERVQTVFHRDLLFDVWLEFNFYVIVASVYSSFTQISVGCFLTSLLADLLSTPAITFVVLFTLLDGARR